MLRAAGMGNIEMSRTAEGFVVKVQEPIIPATETKIHDHFLTGVIAGATGYLLRDQLLGREGALRGQRVGVRSAGGTGKKSHEDDLVSRAENDPIGRASAFSLCLVK